MQALLVFMYIFIRYEVTASGLVLLILLFPSPGDLPDPGIEPRSPALQADALPSEPPGKIFVCISYINKLLHILLHFS